MKIGTVLHTTVSPTLAQSLEYDTFLAKKLINYATNG